MMTRIRAGATAVGLAALLAVTLGCGGPTPQAAGGATTGDAFIARVGDRTLTLEEVDKQARARFSDAYQALYDARRETINAWIAEQVLEVAAAEQGLSQEELIAREIDAKLTPVTDEDVSSFYASNKGRMGQATLEQMQERIRQFLRNQQRQEAYQGYLAKLRSGTNVAVLLEPPRSEVVVAANDPSIGPENAPVQIVAWSEFQ